jgi:Protein of unknown function (DUF5818)
MTVPRNHILLAPAAALVIGGALFALGYSLRPEPGQSERTQAKAAQTIIETPRASAAGSPEIVRSTLPSVAATPAPPDQRQIRSGIIVSMNGELYILRDDENNTWYHLDDQKTAGSFLGKKVTVIGEVNAATDVIHVERIEAARV